jgi:lipopolysaccharide biosynthesis glycosyltransferase
MNCLFTLNIKNKQGWNAPFTTDRVRRTFISACHRWGCNYAEINHDHNPDDKICNWGKILGPRLLIGYEKLLYLDSDMLVSDHAPSPFDLCVEDDTVYAVADMQGPNAELNPAWHSCIYGANTDRIIAKYPSFRKPPVREYFNSGLMLFKNTEAVREAFDLVDQNREFESPTCYDQTVINMFVHNRLKVRLLPEAWNYIVWGRPTNPDAFINHHAQAGPSLA